MFVRKVLLSAALITAVVGLSAAVAGPPATGKVRMPADEAAFKYTPSLLRLMDEQASPHRVWVFFADKGIDTAAEYRRAIAAVELLWVMITSETASSVSPEPARCSMDAIEMPWSPRMPVIEAKTPGLS